MTKIYSLNKLKDALAALFTSGARIAILRIFMLDPQRSYYQRQLEAATGYGLRAVQRELERLAEVELLYRRMEGNRAYYHVDTEFPLFPELRQMILKTCDEPDRLRGEAALSEGVRLLFLSARGTKALIVIPAGHEPGKISSAGIEIEEMSSDDFLGALASDPKSLEPFLKGGVDLLGRRDDLIWRRIEQAGFQVKKGKGIP